MSIKCSICGKTWSGKTEIEAELNPCDCSIKASKMTSAELLAKIKETS